MAAISANCVINVSGTLLFLNRYSLDGIWMTNDCNEYMFRENVVIGMSVIDAEAVCVIFFMTTTMNAAKASVVVVANRGTISPLHECQESIRYLSYTHTCQTARKPTFRTIPSNKHRDSGGCERVGISSHQR